MTLAEWYARHTDPAAANLDNVRRACPARRPWRLPVNTATLMIGFVLMASAVAAAGVLGVWLVSGFPAR